MQQQNDRTDGIRATSIRGEHQCGIESTTILLHKRGKMSFVSFMAKNRWPIITTSVSGIDREMWGEFKRTAERRGLTHREAAESAINQLSADVAAKTPVDWIPVRGALSHSIRAHEAVWRKVLDLARTSGYRQNIIILTALKRWMDNA